MEVDTINQTSCDILVKVFENLRRRPNDLQGELDPDYESALKYRVVYISRFSCIL
jgi:hypothetical protein